MHIRRTKDFWSLFHVFVLSIERTLKRIEALKNSRSTLSFKDIIQKWKKKKRQEFHFRPDKMPFDWCDKSRNQFTYLHLQNIKSFAEKTLNRPMLCELSFGRQSKLWQLCCSKKMLTKAFKNAIELGWFFRWIMFVFNIIFSLYISAINTSYICFSLLLSVLNFPILHVTSFEI